MTVLRRYPCKEFVEPRPFKSGSNVENAAINAQLNRITFLYPNLSCAGKRDAARQAVPPLFNVRLHVATMRLQRRNIKQSAMIPPLGQVAPDRPGRGIGLNGLPPPVAMGTSSLPQSLGVLPASALFPRRLDHPRGKTGVGPR